MSERVEIDGEEYVSHGFRVLYEQTDAIGVVYYSNYLIYFEMGRVEYMRYFGYSYRDFEEDTGGAMPVIESYAEYKSFARYDDELNILTNAEIFNRVKVRFNYLIYRGEELLTKGYTIHPYVDSEGNVRRLPEKIVKIVEGENI